MTDSEIEERRAGEAWARGALRKPEPDAKPQGKEQARAAWLASLKAEPEAAAIRSGPMPADGHGMTRVTRMVDGRAVTYRTDLSPRGAHYPIGGQRTALDGTQWQRVA